MAVPLLESLALERRDVTADALHPQRKRAELRVARGAHHHFTVKGNQPKLQAEIALLFQQRQAPDFVQFSPPDHGRIETRKIGCSDALRDYLDFPPRGPGLPHRAPLQQQEDR